MICAVPPARFALDKTQHGLPASPQQNYEVNTTLNVERAYFPGNFHFPRVRLSPSRKSSENILKFLKGHLLRTGRASIIATKIFKTSSFAEGPLPLCFALMSNLLENRIQRVKEPLGKR